MKGMNVNKYAIKVCSQGEEFVTYLIHSMLYKFSQAIKRDKSRRCELFQAAILLE